jgi:hypothetical protein
MINPLTFPTWARRFVLACIWLVAFATAGLTVAKYVRVLHIKAQTLAVEAAESKSHSVTRFGFAGCSEIAPTPPLPRIPSRGAHWILVAVRGSKSEHSSVIQPQWQRLISNAPASIEVWDVVTDSLSPDDSFQSYLRQSKLNYRTFQVRDSRTFRLTSGVVGVPMTILSDSDGNVHLAKAGFPTTDEVDLLASLLRSPVRPVGRTPFLRPAIVDDYR